MFSLDEKVVYPGHGVAQVNRIVEKMIAGRPAHFYELKFLNKDMTILVPVANLAAVGIRHLSTQDNIESAFKILAEPARLCHELTASNWNKRSKEYQCKLRSGDLREICRIYRDLKYIATQKELSFGEKNLLQQTESLLVEEISLVQAAEIDATIQQLRGMFAKPTMQYSRATTSL